MARIITKQHAEAIARKLGAVQVRSGAHIVAEVYHEGRLIAEFGIRHGSEKDQGHDHIPRDLNIGPNKARQLAQCPLSRAQWIEILREKGLIGGPTQPGATDLGGTGTPGGA